MAIDTHNIETEDGITITGIPLDVMPNSPQVKKRVEEVRAARKDGGATVTEEFETPSMRYERKAATAVRYGAPLASGVVAGLATGGMGAVPAFIASTGIGAAAGGGAEAAGQMIAGEEFSGRKIAGATILGAMPAVAPLKIAGPSSLQNVMNLGANAMMQGATAAGFSTAAQLAETGKISPSAATISGGIGTIAGALGPIGVRATKNIQAARQFAKQAEEAGVEFGDVPIQYVLPYLGKGFDRNVAIKDSLASAKDAAFRNKLLQQAQGSVGELAEGGLVAKQLQTYVDQLDETTKTLAKQSNEAARATLAVQEAEDRLKSVAGNPEAVRLAKMDVAIANDTLRQVRLADINRAAAAYARGLTPEGQAFSPTEAADVWANRVRAPMDAHLKKEASRRFSEEAIGITTDMPLLTTDDITDAVNTVLTRNNAAENEFGINLIAGFKKAKNDAGEVIDEAAPITLNGVREIRRTLMDSLDEAPQGNTRYDSLAKQVDFEIANRTRNAIKERAGDQALANYDDANRYYRGVIEAKTNPQGRALFGRQVNDEAVDAMVSKVRTGKFDEYSAAVRYIDSVASGAPEIQSAMKVHLHKLVRDSLVARHTNNLGALDQRLDVQGLLKDVAALGVYKMKSGAMFPVEDLGFGSVQQIRETESLLRRFTEGTTLRMDDLKSFYGNPAVTKALSTGIGFSEAAKKAAAGVAVARDAYAAEMLKSAGAPALSRDLYAKAAAKARQAGLAVEETQAIVAQQKRDPVLRAFGEGRTFGLTPGDAQPDFGRFIDFMNNPNTGTTVEKVRLARNLEKQNPRLWEQVKSRYLVDKLNVITTTPRNPNLRRGIDFQAADLLIHGMPKKDRASELATMRIILGKDTMDRLAKMAPMISSVASAEKTLATIRPGETVAKAAGAIGAVRGYATGTGQGAVGAETTAQRALNPLLAGRAHITAFLFQNPVAFKVYQATSSIQKALGSVGSQRAALLLANPEFAYEVGQEVQDGR